MQYYALGCKGFFKTLTTDLDAVNDALQSRGLYAYFIACFINATDYFTCITAVIVQLFCLRTYYILHGKSGISIIDIIRHFNIFQNVQERIALIPGKIGRLLDYIIAIDGADGNI